jgi:hypothetical protein
MCAGESLGGFAQSIDITGRDVATSVDLFGKVYQGSRWQRSAKEEVPQKFQEMDVAEDFIASTAIAFKNLLVRFAARDAAKARVCKVSEPVLRYRPSSGKTSHQGDYRVPISPDGLMIYAGCVQFDCGQ